MDYIISMDPSGRRSLCKSGFWTLCYIRCSWKGFIICGCHCGALCHWEYLILGPLKRQFPPGQESRWPNAPIPRPCPKKPFAQKGHFISCEPVIQVYITGPRAGHHLSIWRVGQWRPQPLRLCPVTQPSRELSAWWQAGGEPNPLLTSGLILMNLGFLAEKQTGSWYVQDSALETSGLMTDMLVSWDRAVQLRKVARASDLRGSSGPHKKAIANWEKARLHSSQLYWLIRQSHPLHLCL